MFNVTNDIVYVGVNDHNIDLFEGQYVVKNGMSYNSYIIFDEKIAIMDSVDKNFTNEWLDNIEKVLNGRKPDYLVVSHMEPDHSANIMNLLNKYKDVTIVASKKAFAMIENFFHKEISNQLIVGENDQLKLGKHTLLFKEAPMVHWPEVIVSYDTYDKVLFSADGFGKFGALDVDEPWVDEARRYYIGIVGKYGIQVQSLLKKVSSLDINIIAPLHGPVLKENLGYYLDFYNKWSSYESEDNGILICYSSVYGHTKKAIEVLIEKLKNKGVKTIVSYDLARCDMAQAVSEAFKFNNIVLASTTYNLSIFPCMKEFINHLLERNFQNKRVAFVENGSWAPIANRVMKDMLKDCKNITYTNATVSIKSSLDDKSSSEIDLLVEELIKG